jgi:Domain of unknown function (DUF4129)
MFLAAVGAAVFALLLLAAIGSGSEPGTTRSLRLSWTVDVIEWIQVGVGILIVAAILLSLVAGRREREEDRPRRQVPNRKRPAWAVLLVLTALALLVLFIPRHGREVDDETQPDFTISEVHFPPVEDIGNAWPLLVLAVGTVVAAFAVSRIDRPEPDRDTVADPGSLIADTIGGALDDLSWSDDPRAVIIKAYHDIEQALGAVGLGRRASEAPREYLHRVLGAADIDPAAIGALTDLFEQARYSDHPMGPNERRAAIEALETARFSLAVPR